MKEQAKATAPARKIGNRYLKQTDPLKWKYPSDLWDFESQTAYERIVDWLTNFRINLDTIGFQNSVSDLPQIEGSALVIDKSMASTKYFEQLPELKNYHGTIICADRALPSLIQYGIIPKLVCQLDSSYLCQYFFDVPSVKSHMHEITGVFAVTTHPLTIRLFHGKRAFFVPYIGSMGITKALMEKSGLPMMTTGGQVASFAHILAYNLGAKNIGIFGVTHSYDNLVESEYPEVRHKRVSNKYGVFWQDPVYEWYNNIYLSLIEAAAKKGVTTFNTMKGGLLYSKYVKDVSLKEFIEQHG